MTFTGPPTPTSESATSIPILAGTVPAPLADALRAGVPVVLISRWPRPTEIDRSISWVSAAQALATGGVQVGHMLTPQVRRRRRQLRTTQREGVGPALGVGHTVHTVGEGLTLIGLTSQPNRTGSGEPLARGWAHDLVRDLMALLPAVIAVGHEGLGHQLWPYLALCQVAHLRQGSDLGLLWYVDPHIHLQRLSEHHHREAFENELAMEAWPRAGIRVNPHRETRRPEEEQ